MRARHRGIRSPSSEAEGGYDTPEDSLTDTHTHTPKMSDVVASIRLKVVQLIVT